MEKSMDETEERVDQAETEPAGEQSLTQALPAVTEPQEPQANNPEATTTATRRSSSACVIMAITFAILSLSCLILGAGTLRSGLEGLGRLGGVLPSLNLSLVTTPTVTIDTSKPTILQSVRALSKLESVNYQLEKVVTGKSSGPLFDFLTSDKILLVAHGDVVAGVDFSKVKAENVNEQGYSVTVYIPAAEILYSKLDNDKTYVYDRQTGIFSKP